MLQEVGTGTGKRWEMGTTFVMRGDKGVYWDTGNGGRVKSGSERDDKGR